MGFMSRIFGSRRAAALPSTPDGALIYAVGDVHGRADVLDKLLAQIEADAADHPAQPELIFLGDYVDRGADSRGVIDRIIELGRAGRFAVRTLKGNHEEALLDFFADGTFGREWVQYGGRETLLSYGVSPPVGASSVEQWIEASRAFAAALPADHLAFLQSLELSIVRGDYVFVHAGLRPGVSLAAQSEKDLLWIRHEFLSHDRAFEKVVVHGHSPEPEPFHGRYRIGVDTGAYATHRLTAARLSGTDVRFLTASCARRTDFRI